MRTLEECRAEVFLRSEKRIKEIKTRRRRTLTLGIVTALTVTALLSSLLPMAMNKLWAQPNNDITTTRPIVEGDGLTGNEQDNDTRPHPEGPDSEGMDIEIVYDIEADYCIVSDGESYYLIIDNEEYYNSDSNASVEEPLLTFTSVEEMKDKVLGGKLTEKEKQTMSQFSKDENGNIKVLDFSKLCTPSLPEGASVEFVHWNGQSYSLSINTPSAGYCNFFVMDSEQYNVSFKRDYG